MSNLRNIKSTTTAGVIIKDETGASTGVTIELAGPTHPKRKAITFAAARRAQARFRQSNKVEFDDPEEQALEAKSNLAACTLGWSGYTDDAGVPVPFSEAAAAALYADDEMSWLVDQLQVAIGEKERFMARSATA